MKRISIDPQSDQAIAHAWNSPQGRASARIEVQAGDHPCLCYVRLSEFLSDEEKESLATDIAALHPAIQFVQMQTEVEVPEELEGRQWMFHLSSHLRSEVVTPTES